MDPYHAQILEHYRDPLNFGLLEQPTYQREEWNPTCGDKFTFSIHVTTHGIVDQVGFSGEGCAISTAAASLLSEAIKGKTLAAALELQPAFVLDLLGIDLGPTRLKCALLPLQAITRITLPASS
ncbi:MAG: iron-sulfur cluster assembly scaffold protein [Candidatus Kerfeldbacteria bacterium]|nr:iron-sulfur cluster assembly scaffold protein [Candidatus Kerfeldbacteria bacterium]